MADINETLLESGAYGKNARVTSPTMGLRWMNGKLQQAWLVTQCGEVNQTIKRWIEWRDVPDETPAQPPAHRGSET